MKSKSKFIVVLLCLSLMLLPSFASAKSNKNPQEFDYSSVNPENIIRPMWDSYQYRLSYETQRRVENFSHTAQNPSDYTDSVSYAVTHTFSATTTLGGSAEFNGLMAKASFTSNVSVGTSKSVTVTVTWAIPKGRWRIYAGTEFNKVVGYRDYYINAQLISSDPMTIDYSYGTYSGKTYLGA